MSHPSAIEAGHHTDYTGAKIGMWLFLFTELLLFGGLFLLYAVFRSKNADAFHEAAAHLDIMLGTFNTLILLTSSLTVVLSLEAARAGNRRRALILLTATIAMGFFFLVNKFFEWGAKIDHGIYPGSPDLLSMEKGEALFYSLYYAMTGLHGLHVVAGMAILAWMIRPLLRSSQTGPQAYVGLENGALYWHFVDIIWIFLFPLFYLIS
ncbi:MAG: cytochrome C oxidase subunit III [Planctomycetes bacterium RBG_16_59_8]|nr:MAG: cytochrome C oxidase subunit III [Planctomycetes bacterium RBG_16_59_8]